MSPGDIHRNDAQAVRPRRAGGRTLDWPRSKWLDLLHLAVIDSEQLSGLGLEPIVTTRELAELADAWLEDLRIDVDRSDGTKEVWERELAPEAG